MIFFRRRRDPVTPKEAPLFDPETDIDVDAPFERQQSTASAPVNPQVPAADSVTKPPVPRPVRHDPILGPIYAWQENPLDFGPLPDVDLDSLPERAVNSYMEKLKARVFATGDFDREVEEFGLQMSPEEREEWIQDRALTYAADDAESLLRDRKNRREEERHRETLDAIENSTAYGAAKKFAHEHPFVAGLVGAEILHQLKKK